MPLHLVICDCEHVDDDNNDDGDVLTAMLQFFYEVKMSEVNGDNDDVSDGSNDVFIAKLQFFGEMWLRSEVIMKLHP